MKKAIVLVALGMAVMFGIRACHSSKREFSYGYKVRIKENFGLHNYMIVKLDSKSVLINDEEFTFESKEKLNKWLEVVLRPYTIEKIENL